MCCLVPLYVGQEFKELVAALDLESAASFSEEEEDLSDIIGRVALVAF